MTLEEKVSLLGGTGFASRAIDRLGIPALEMTALKMPICCKTF
ncbi:MAG: hypothetical protein ACOYMG_09030 [Candidatus Methylumidiphilus sp.]